jgi:hypothetical protein
MSGGKTPEWLLWGLGITIPLAGAAIYHRLHASPTDVVTDVTTGSTPETLHLTYNMGPPDDIVFKSDVTTLVPAAKQLILGLTRDRVAAALQGMQA